MAIQKQTSAQYFKSLNLIHYALAAGQLLFAILAYALQKENWFTTSPASDALRYAVSLIAVMGVTGGSINYKRQADDISNKKNLSVKLNAYRFAVITRDAFFSFRLYLRLLRLYLHVKYYS